MQTVEAILEKNKISFDNKFIAPKWRTRVLLTFIDDDSSNYELIELEKNQVSDSLLEWQKNTLKKDKSLFTNI